MVDFSHLMVVELSGAVVNLDKASPQMPFSVVLADVTGGTLKIEVSRDGFAADTRRIALITAGASPSVQEWIHHRVLTNEKIRFNLSAGTAHVRLEPTTLA
jgi:hypothetical protein